MEFPVDSTDYTTSAKMSYIADGRLPQTDVSCYFYDTRNSEISTEGCILKEVTASSVKCSCTHMTDFAGFFKTGLSVLEDSNYDVFLALTQLNFSNLKHNIGLYFAVAYWALFIVLCLTLLPID